MTSSKTNKTIFPLGPRYKYLKKYLKPKKRTLLSQMKSGKPSAEVDAALSKSVLDLCNNDEDVGNGGSMKIAPFRGDENNFVRGGVEDSWMH
jgi:hypothetical protein